MDLELDVKSLLVAPPILPWRDFSVWIGMGEDSETVLAWVKRGYLPTVKIGKHRMVNVALLTQQLLNDETEV